ncbi:MAG: DedA family protein [Armatimonadetes bacterium]|nr:DedA family protein [Armatimonadota bacterium]
MDWIRGFMTYPGIAFLMFLENVFPPLPSELIMPLAGFQTGQGKLSLLGVIIAGAVGSLVGQLPLYYLGKWVGKDKLKAWADKHGEWLAVSGDDIEKSDEWFDKHGSKAVLIGRLVPGVRSLVSIPAGFADMPLPKFLAYSAIGTTVWAAVLGYLGSLLGDRYEQVEKFVGPVSYVVLGGMVLFFVIRVVKRKREKAHETAEKPA